MNNNNRLEEGIMRLLRSMQALLLFTSVSFSSSLYTMNLMNMAPYNPLICPYSNAADIAQSFFMLEGGIGHARAFDAHNSVSPLHIYDCQQNALTMLEGFPDESPQSILLAQINPFQAGDDGKRGRFNVCGNLKLDAGGGFGLRYFWGGGWSINAYLPFYSMHLTDVRWQDQTAHITSADERVHMLLTDNIYTNVFSLGDGLFIGDWHRAGIGDLTVLVQWHRDFPQAKPVLKNVAINTRAGLSAPTGLRRDVNTICSLPFGADGAWTLPFALNLELTLGCYLQVGLDAQLIHLFGRTEVERIPTMVHQTTLLYLQKACAFRDFGWNQQLSIYGGIIDLPKGFSARVGYQFIKQGSDHISLASNFFSTEIANNTAFLGNKGELRPDLRDWTAHQIIVRADYDCSIWLKDACVSPRFSLFAELPFNGRRSILFTTIGGSIALDF
jgi:hypothetical protein